MTFQKPALRELKSESDVEQKFIFPLLTTATPYGFGHATSDIITKHNVRKFVIGKGAEQKSYFPDYVIVKGGLPLVVVEAKPPNSELESAFREARLYASEMNAIFESGTNPLSTVIATNGNHFWVGHHDQAEPILKLTYDEVDPYAEKFGKAQELVGRDAINESFARIASKIKPHRYFKPRRLLGGASVQNDELGHNSFGATVTAEFAHVFNPVLRKDRARVATEGYIPSKRREKYIDPIDKVIRASTPAFQKNMTLIEDTGNPTELQKPFENLKQLEHQVLLIVGGVGSGKTTFVDRLQEVALTKEVREKTVWVHLNMNSAPISASEIYDWVRKEIVSGMTQHYSDIEHDALDTIKAVYSVEVNRFKKGLGQLFPEGSDQFNQRLFEVLEKADSDLHNRAMAHCRYFGTERQKLVIVVLDNCDKRSRDEQLLMFEVAQWLQREFRALVILPIREETYDNHQNEPPLDTALKDLVFRIEPPPFQSVLVSRVQLAINQIESSGPRLLHYNLPNGFRVEYPASEQAFYLSSIIRSVFEYDRQIRRMIVGLAGRNLRRAFEIFIEICNSGHISEDHILKIRQSRGEYVLPLHLVVTVLLRSTRRFYDSDKSHLKNLLDLDIKDRRPSHFSRIMVLRYLVSKFALAGPTGLKGYLACTRFG